MNKENCLADPTQINWNDYLKMYENDTDLSFELFLRNINFLHNKHSPLITSVAIAKKITSKNILKPTKKIQKNLVRYKNSHLY